MAAAASPRTSCRVCGQPLSDVLDLGSFAPSDFVRPDEPDPPLVPLCLAECSVCGLVQLRHTVDRDSLYRQYWYHSGLNSSMVESLRDVVRGVQARVELIAGDAVVDVGANDGTLLGLYENPGIYRIGFDPAQNLAETARQKCDEFVSDYFESSTYDCPRAKVLSSVAMFYDLDDPRRFVRRVREVLDPKGIWVLQMTDLVRMLRSNAFDNVCHEHLVYYSLWSLCDLLHQEGLTVFDVEFNDVNGGSLRAYAAHRGSRKTEPTVDQALQDEQKYLTPMALADFGKRVNRARARLMVFISQERESGKFFHVLGASTKGNTLLQYYGLTSTDIECAAEVNPAKVGLETAGTRIPIIDQSESLRMLPDYYLVLPWHFMDFFRQRFADYLANGGKLIAPLPTPIVYGDYGERHLYQEHRATG